MRRVAIVGTVLAVLIAAGQASQRTTRCSSGSRVPCGFIKCNGARAGVPKGTTLDQFLPGQGHDQRRGHGHVLERELPHRVSYGPSRRRSLVPDPAKGKYARAERRGREPVLLRRAARSSSTTGSAFARSARRRSRADGDVERRALARPARRRSRRPTPTPSRRRGRTHLFCNDPPGHEGHGRRQAGRQRRCRRRRRRCRPRRSQSRTAAWAKAKAEAAAASRRRTPSTWASATTTTILGYFPQTLTVKAGTTVTFVNKSPTRGAQHRLRPEEVHPRASRRRPTCSRPARRPEPGLAVPDLRLGAEGRVQLRRHEPRQRLLRDAGDDPARPAVPLPQVVEGDVHEARHVQVLLLDPRA